MERETDLERTLGILERIPEGAVIRSFLDFVPLGCPDFWEMEPRLKVLASLDRHFIFREGCFRKLTAAEYLEARKAWYRDKFTLLMTDPHMLDDWGSYF